MIIVNDLNGRDFAIKFYHNIDTKRPSTRCDIVSVPAGTPFTADNGRVVLSGATKVHENDTYSRAKGRKLALARALQGLDNREMRLVFWKAYAKSGVKDLTVEQFEAGARKFYQNNGNEGYLSELSDGPAANTKEVTAYDEYGFPFLTKASSNGSLAVALLMCNPFYIPDYIE